MKTVPGCPRSPDVQSGLDPNRFRKAPPGSVACIFPPSPGPWHASPTLNGRAYDIGASDGGNVALVYGPEMGGPECVKENVALILAAPDLLAALRDVRAFVQDEMEARIDSHTIRGDLATLNDEDGGRVGEVKVCLRRIEAAIAKAEGRL